MPCSPREPVATTATATSITATSLCKCPYATPTTQTWLCPGYAVMFIVDVNKAEAGSFVTLT